MLKIYTIIFFLILINTNKVYLQDKIAKTDKGQTVILKDDGTWYVKNNIAIRDNKAITDDGKLVLLGGDGKWFLTKIIVTSPSKQQESNQNIEKDYSSSDGILTISYSSAMVTGTAFVHVPASKKNYLASPRPLMLMLDPAGDAASIVARWQHAADRFGWIVASTPAIQNGTSNEQDMLHLLALLDAVATKWPVDRQAVILDGFSGGACGAYLHALERPDLFRGAIVECGHMGSFRDFVGQIRSGSLFYLATRNQDFNEQHMRDLASALEESGETVKFVELSGGHASLKGADTDDALGWFNSQIR